MMTTYYLETNALRGLGKKILKLEPTKKYRTSVLSLLELISSGYDSDRNFLVCKSCMQNLMTSKIEIDFAYPEKKLALSFGNLQHIEKRQEDLQEVMRCILQSLDRNSCQDLLSAKKLKYGIEFIHDYDGMFGKQFIDASIAGCRDIKMAFDTKKAFGQTIFDSEELALPFLEFCKVFATKYVSLNRSITVWALAMQMSTWLHDSPSDELIGQVYNSYNGRLDTLVDALSYYSMIQAGKMNQPGRNDFLDLFHFAYVTANDIFVTDDKDIISICNVLKTCNTISPSSLPLLDD